MSCLPFESLSDADLRAIMVRCFCNGSLELDFASAQFYAQNVCVRNGIQSDRLRL